MFYTSPRVATPDKWPGKKTETETQHVPHASDFLLNEPIVESLV